MLQLFQTDQGIKNLSVERAGYLAGANPDYALKDLFDAIGSGNYVSHCTIVYSLHAIYETRSMVYIINQSSMYMTWHEKMGLMCI